MSTAFDYKIRPLDVPASGCNAGRGRSGPCPETPVYQLSYRYTGGAGRETERKTPACTAHAQNFATRHGVTLPQGVDA